MSAVLRSHILLVANTLLEDVAEDPARLARARELAERDIGRELDAYFEVDPNVSIVAVERMGDAVTTVWVKDRETGKEYEMVRKPVGNG